MSTVWGNSDETYEGPGDWQRIKSRGCESLALRDKSWLFANKRYARLAEFILVLLRRLRSLGTYRHDPR